MRVPEPVEEVPLSWKAILEDTPVRSSDGEEVGVITEVLGSEDTDIFHGVVLRHGALGEHRMIPADKVTTITNKLLNTSLTAHEVRELPPHREEESYKLGFVGLFRKHLGWVRDEERPQ